MLVPPSPAYALTPSASRRPSLPHSACPPAKNAPDKEAVAPTVDAPVPWVIYVADRDRAAGESAARRDRAGRVSSVVFAQQAGTLDAWDGADGTRARREAQTQRGVVADRVWEGRG